MTSVNELSPIGAEIKSKVTELVPMLRKRGAEIDQLGKLPDDVVKALYEAGVYKMVVPQAMGGYYPMKPRDIFEIILELGKGNSSAAWSAMINLSSALVLGFPEKAVQEFFDPTHIGPFAGQAIFNQSHSEGFARKVDGGYMVKGSWSFSSNIRMAKWQVGSASVLDEDGNMTAYINVIIPRSEIKISDDWRVTGLRGTASNSGFTEEEVFVPEYRTLDVTQLASKAQSTGLRDALSDGTLNKSQAAAAAAMALGAGSNLAAMALGAGYGALETFMEKAKTRKPWGQAYPSIAEMPSTQIMVAKFRGIINMCEATLERTVNAADRMAAGEVIESGFIKDGVAAIEPHLAMTMLRDGISELRTTMGSSTAAEGDLLGRFERDVRTMCLHGMLRLDWWAETYGRKLFGLPPLSGINMSSDPTGKPPSKHQELVGG